MSLHVTQMSCFKNRLSQHCLEPSLIWLWDQYSMHKVLVSSWVLAVTLDYSRQTYKLLKLKESDPPTTWTRVRLTAEAVWGPKQLALACLELLMGWTRPSLDLCPASLVYLTMTQGFPTPVSTHLNQGVRLVTQAYRLLQGLPSRNHYLVLNRLSVGLTTATALPSCHPFPLSWRSRKLKTRLKTKSFVSSWLNKPSKFNRLYLLPWAS